jgi:peptidoglycan/xylan/chitin deacetylase (PgdA/CDA1 family)
MKPQYLLRFDDICPTMNWRVWDEVEKILCDREIKPILAIVPDNQDKALQVCAPSADFWQRAREWQARGWTLAMHGWQHRSVSTNPGILRVQHWTEFAGLSRDEQRKKLLLGMAKFEDEAINSRLWVAPAHSYDSTTISLLVELGFLFGSDGYFMFPHSDRFGMTWIPQQLWSFRRRPLGVWTICFHLNHWSAADVQSFRSNVAQFRNVISTFDDVIARYRGRPDTILDSFSASMYRAAAAAKPVIYNAIRQLNSRSVVRVHKTASKPSVSA